MAAVRATGAMAAVKKPKTGEQPAEGGLSWDDDELETQIYDNPEDKAAATVDVAVKRTSKSTSSQMPLQAAPPPPAPAPVPAPPPPAPMSAGPDLASLSSTMKGWEATKDVAPPAPTKEASPIPSKLANGSKPKEDPLAALAASYAPPAAPNSLIAQPSPFAATAASASGGLPMIPPNAKLTPPEPLFDPMSSFGSGMLGRQGATKREGANNKLFLAIGGAAVAVVAVVVIIAMTGGNKDKKTPVADKTAAPAQPVAAAATNDDPNTGFDLYVNPPGMLTWKLDGEARTSKLPGRVRGITPGVHKVEIDAPAGYMSQNQTITVESGKAPKVDIVLQPLDIAGAFTSEPAGATVSLIVDGKRETVGQSPAKMKLDPRKTYQVLFEKPGYVSVNKPIVFTGATEEPIAVTLEKAGSPTPIAAVAPVQKTNPPIQKIEPPKVEKTGPVTRPEKTETAKVEKVEAPKPDKTELPKPEKAVAETKGGEGTLLLGSKPPCDIYIDGKATGLQTPQRDIKLASGKHKVTLVNNEFGIKESFSVDIKADATEKQIKDYSDRIK
jgi:hypothetical protein